MDNTVGSLTKEQTSIITGKLLGDGSLRKKQNTLLEVNHSYKQKEYVLWQYEKLRNLILTEPKLRKSGVNRYSMRFTTRSLACLNDFYAQYYPNSLKCVYKGLVLDPISFAVWYMDDGSKSGNSVYLNTQQFSYVDQCYLVKRLAECGFTVSLNKDKSYFRLRFYRESGQTFCRLVAPLVIDSMKYKLLL